MKKVAIDIRRRLNSGIGRVTQWLVNNIREEYFDQTTLCYIATEDSWKDYLLTDEKCLIVECLPFSEEEIREIPALLQEHDFTLFINPQINLSPHISTPTITVIHDTWYLLHKQHLPTISDVQYRFNIPSTEHFEKIANLFNDEMAKQTLTPQGSALWKKVDTNDILGKYAWSLFSIITKQSTQIVFVSKQVEATYKSLFKRRDAIQTIENDIEFEAQAEKTDIKTLFLCLAKLEKRKNLLFLLDAYEKYAETTQQPAKPLVIIGDKGYGSYSKKVLKRIARLQKKGVKARYLTSQNDKELSEHFNRAVALISTSHTEAFGLPVLEAISQGIPVFSSKTGKITEWFDENDTLLFFDKNRPESLTNLLIAITENPNKFAEHSKKLKNNLLKQNKTSDIRNAWISVVRNYL